MIDFLTHEPADNALRRVLAPWFGRAEAAKAEFAAKGYDAARLIESAGAVTCPYGIDLTRKARLATAKLTDADPRLV